VTRTRDQSLFYGVDYDVDDGPVSVNETAWFDGIVLEARQQPAAGQPGQWRRVWSVTPEALTLGATHAAGGWIAAESLAGTYTRLVHFSAKPEPYHHRTGVTPTNVSHTKCLR
jgi:hypothetical protein